MKFAPTCLVAASALICSTLPASAESRNFDLPDFDRIDISAGVRLIADVGDNQSVRVETEYGDFSDFEIEVRNGELTLSREWNRLRWHDKKSDYTVFVTMPNIRSLDASSGSESTIDNIHSDNFSVDISSGAHAKVSGQCESCTIDISSGALLYADTLNCNTANVDVSSGGHGEVSVKSSVAADASSGGYVIVYGEPTRVNIDKSSGGSVKIKPMLAQASNN